MGEEGKYTGRHISIDLEAITYTLDKKPINISKIIPSEEWFMEFEELWNDLCDLCKMFLDEGLVLDIPKSLMQDNTHPTITALCRHYDNARWVRESVSIPQKKEKEEPS
jgi:hypothetical protein